MTLTEGMKVVTTEHPGSIGIVQEVKGSGDVVIEFVTPVSESLPYGHIIKELWKVGDLDFLEVL